MRVTIGPNVNPVTEYKSPGPERYMCHCPDCQKPVLLGAIHIEPDAVFYVQKGDYTLGGKVHLSCGHVQPIAFMERC